MIKPDTLWNLFKHGDKETIGRVCMALANRQNELETPLNGYEVMFFNMIREAEEWMDDAVHAVKQRKHAWYEKKKLQSHLADLASNSSNQSTASIDHHPSVRPSIRPSVQKKSIKPLPSSSATDGDEGGREGGREGGIANKGSDEFKHVSRIEVKQYFGRMRQNGGRNLSQETEEDFWQYLVQADFKKGDGSPITKSNVHTTFNVWMTNRRKEANAIREQQEAEAAKKSEAAAESKRKEDLAWQRMSFSLTHETDD